MPRTFDEDGRQLDGLNDLGASGVYTPPDSLGAALWEYLHPAEVQAEYVALGQTPPSAAEIMAKSSVSINTNLATKSAPELLARSAAAGIQLAEDTAERIVQGFDAVVDSAGDFGREIGKYAIIGAVLWVAVEALRAYGGRKQ